MEKHQYILNLSLKQMSLRKVAIVLWHQADILALVKSFVCQYLNCESTTQRWRKYVENLVIEKVAILLLPESLKQELVHVIKPIGPEIIKWRVCHESFISDSFLALDQLCWTSAGTVDYTKTADMLIRQERLTIMSCYKLACIYCLDDHIRVIWEKLSEDNKKLFYGDKNIPWHSQPELVIFWTYLIKGEVAKLDPLIHRNGEERERTLDQYVFETAALSGNKAAAEYFFQKLTFEEREASLLEATHGVCDKRYLRMYISYHFPKEKFSDVLCYLLSQMKVEEQMQVFKKNPYEVLSSLMDWPWQDIFLKVIGLMWDFLPHDEYGYVMNILSHNRTMTGYNYPKLFGEIFLHAPSHYRKYMVDKHFKYGTWFRELIYGNQMEIIKLVLRNISDKDRQEFILCEEGLHLSWRLIEEVKWSLLDLFVSECRLSSEAKAKLKNSFMRYITRFYKEGQIKWRKRVWERLFQLIDNANANDGNKRILEEVEKEEQLRRNKPKRRRRRRKD